MNNKPVITIKDAEHPKFKDSPGDVFDVCVDFGKRNSFYFRICHPINKNVKPARWGHPTMKVPPKMEITAHIHEAYIMAFNVANDLYMIRKNMIGKVVENER